MNADNKAVAAAQNTSKTLHGKKNKSLKEAIFDRANVCVMVLLSLITLYPFWYVLVLSFNTGRDAAEGPIWFWPRQFTLENYVYVLNYGSLKSAFAVTVGRCIAGALLTVSVSMLAAFSLSKRFLPGRKAILFFFMLPMFIGGTMISHYVVVTKLHLLNNFLVYVIPGAFTFFGMVIMRTHIEEIPGELEESAMLDGANYWTIFIRIILPLSKPIIAAFLFFSIVEGWLDLYTNLIYVTDRKLFTLQYILYMVINSNEASYMARDVNNAGAAALRRMRLNRSSLPTPEVIKMTVMVIVTFPILFIYPFFQKYFIKGMLVGAIKA